MAGRARPRRVARRLLRFFLDGEEREVILGDIDEEYSTEILPKRGRAAAILWYWRQALGSIASRHRLTPGRLRSDASERQGGQEHRGRRGRESLVRFPFGRISDSPHES